MRKRRPRGCGAFAGGAFVWLLLTLFAVPYVALTDLHGKIPPAFLTQALDDDGDGAADAGLWELIASQAGDAIDGVLGQRYATPFDPAPAIVRTAALIFAAEAVYARRGVSPEQNPWKAQADATRAKLAAIGTGAEPLVPGTERERPSATLIGEASHTFSQTGRMAI